MMAGGDACPTGPPPRPPPNPRIPAKEAGGFLAPGFLGRLKNVRDWGGEGVRAHGP